MPLVAPMRSPPQQPPPSSAQPAWLVHAVHLGRLWNDAVPAVPAVLVSAAQILAPVLPLET